MRPLLFVRHFMRRPPGWGLLVRICVLMRPWQLAGMVRRSSSACKPCRLRPFSAPTARHPPLLPHEEGARLLSRLQAQLDTLCSAEDHTREALAEWAALARAHVLQGAGRPAAPAAAAAEQGLALLSRQAAALTDPLGLEALEGAEAEAEGGSSRPPLTLDGLAEDVRRHAPGLFPPSGGGGGGEAGALAVADRRAALAALGHVLYRQHRLRWVRGAEGRRRTCAEGAPVCRGCSRLWIDVWAAPIASSAPPQPVC